MYDNFFNLYVKPKMFKPTLSVRLGRVSMRREVFEVQPRQLLARQSRARANHQTTLLFGHLLYTVNPHEFYIATKNMKIQAKKISEMKTKMESIGYSTISV